MADPAISPSEAEDRLWKALEDTRTGMLGLVGGDEHQHFQPMTAFEDRPGDCLWFFTRDDTDLVRSLGSGHQAMYTLVTKDTKIYACLGGQVTRQADPEVVDRYWNPVVAAWYPHGKDDPHLVLLRFDLDDARVWFNDKGPVMFMVEVAKANLTRSFPDSGDKADVRFQ
jgi:general stress protein 26